MFLHTSPPYYLQCYLSKCRSLIISSDLCWIYNTCQKSSREPRPWFRKSANFDKSVFSYWILLQSCRNWKDSWRSQEQIGHIPFGCRGGNKSAKKAVRKNDRIFAACWVIVGLSLFAASLRCASARSQSAKETVFHYRFIYFSYYRHMVYVL